MFLLRRAAVAAGFLATLASASPPVTDGLVVHLGVESAPVVGPGGTVVSWDDTATGNGNNGATAVDGQGPTLAFGALPLPEVPVLRFDGAGDHLVLAGSPITSPQFTIFAVARDAGGTGFREILSNWSFGNMLESVFLGTVGTDPIRFRFTDAIGGADQGQPGVGTLENPAGFFVLAAVSGASDAFVLQDGALEYSLGSPLPARNLGGTWYLGRQGEFAGEYWHGDLAALLVYDRELGSAEIAATLEYLASATGVIPEPGTAALLAAGLLGLAARARRRRP